MLRQCGVKAGVSKSGGDARRSSVVSTLEDCLERLRCQSTCEKCSDGRKHLREDSCELLHGLFRLLEGILTDDDRLRRFIPKAQTVRRLAGKSSLSAPIRRSIVSILASVPWTCRAWHRALIMGDSSRDCDSGWSARMAFQRMEHTVYMHSCCEVLQLPSG